MIICLVDGCPKPVLCKGRCSAHYHQQYRATRGSRGPSPRNRALARLSEEYPVRFQQLLREEMSEAMSR